MRRRNKRKKPTKECSFCGEQIFAKATKCKHCLSVLDSFPEENYNKKQYWENFSEITEKWREEVSSTAQTAEEYNGQTQGEWQKEVYKIPREQSEELKEDLQELSSRKHNKKEQKEEKEAKEPREEKLLYLQPTSKETSSNITDLYPKALNRKRALAFLIDGLVQAVAFIPGLLLIFISGQELLPVNLTNASDTTFLAGAGLLLLGFLWALFYGLTKDGWRQGQSMGKKVTGLMVINLKDNSPCNKGKSFIRQIITLPAFFAEPFLVLFQVRGKRLGDMAARTQVIEKSLYRKQSVFQGEYTINQHAYIN